MFLSLARMYYMLYIITASIVILVAVETSSSDVDIVNLSCRVVCSSVLVTTAVT